MDFHENSKVRKSAAKYVKHCLEYAKRKLEVGSYANLGLILAVLCFISFLGLLLSQLEVDYSFHISTV